MLIKGMTLFLVVMAGLALFGRLRLPGKGRQKPGLQKPANRCPDCGRPRIGSGRCPCNKGA